MLEVHNAQDVLDRLEVIFQEEGLHVKLASLDDNKVHLDIERFASGAPTAFIVQAIAGTMRRYLPDLGETVLDNYRVLDSARNLAQPSEADHGEGGHVQARIYEKKGVTAGPEGVAGAVPPLSFRGLPGLSLRGVSRAQAAEALEHFTSIMQDGGYQRFRISDVTPELLPVLRQWTAIYRASMHRQGTADDVWVVHTSPLSADHAANCAVAEAGETIPARILLIPSRKSET